MLWDFGDGKTVSGSSLGHAFFSVGNHEVNVRVVYAISYRPKGSASWIAEPETITLADVIQVSVSEIADPNSAVDSVLKQPRALLVGADCLSKPLAFGCQ